MHLKYKDVQLAIYDKSEFPTPERKEKLDSLLKLMCTEPEILIDHQSSPIPAIQQQLKIIVSLVKQGADPSIISASTFNLLSKHSEIDPAQAEKIISYASKTENAAFLRIIMESIGKTVIRESYREHVLKALSDTSSNSSPDCTTFLVREIFKQHHLHIGEFEKLDSNTKDALVLFMSKTLKHNNKKLLSQLLKMHPELWESVLNETINSIAMAWPAIEPDPVLYLALRLKLKARQPAVMNIIKFYGEFSPKNASETISDFIICDIISNEEPENFIQALLRVIESDPIKERRYSAATALLCLTAYSPYKAMENAKCDTSKTIIMQAAIDLGIIQS